MINYNLLREDELPSGVSLPDGLVIPDDQWLIEIQGVIFFIEKVEFGAEEVLDVDDDEKVPFSIIYHLIHGDPKPLGDLGETLGQIVVDTLEKSIEHDEIKKKASWLKEQMAKFKKEQ
jgi:hypothetical protein